MPSLSTHIEWHGADCAVEVEYEVCGRHYPATYWQPEEFPEVEIQAVWYTRFGRKWDISDRLPYSVNNIIEERVMESRETGDDADRAYDEWRDKQI